MILECRLCSGVLARYRSWSASVRGDGLSMAGRVWQLAV